VERLREQIRHHDYRYYVLDRPIITGSAPGSKLDRARTLRIPVISEREFLRRYRPVRERRTESDEH